MLFLLSSLLGSWNILAVIISKSIPGNKSSFSIVKDCLFGKEARSKQIVLISTRLLSLKGEVEVIAED